MSRTRAGSISFEYDIERYKNTKTKEYFTFEQLTPEDRDNEELYSYAVISLDVSGNGSFSPGKYYGPWEDSYPDESDCEIVSAIDAEGKDWAGDLTESEISSIEDHIINFFVDNKYSDRDYDYPEPDYYDEPNDYLT